MQANHLVVSWKQHCADRFYNGEFDRAESPTYTSPSGNPIQFFIYKY